MLVCPGSGTVISNRLKSHGAVVDDDEMAEDDDNDGNSDGGFEEQGTDEDEGDDDDGDEALADLVTKMFWTIRQVYDSLIISVMYPDRFTDTSISSSTRVS
jgi:hypothetical protein